LAELVLATDAQKRERDRFAHDAWGQRLTVDQFVSREERLRAHPWARANMTTYLLVEEGRVLSSCETFRMDSFLDGDKGVTFGVASVYTEPALRGRGHAGRMMRLLPAEGLQAGILFSDVGDYYARFGWRAVGAFEQILSAGNVESDATLLNSAQIDALWNTVEVPRARFVVWPSAAQLDWHRERERAYAELFGRTPLAHAGAKTKEGLIVWAADFKNEKLLILHLQGSDPSLVAAARRQAAEAGLASVVAWEGDFGEKKPRTDSLPMVLPLAAGSESWSFVPRGLWI
jgi:GNAT superfamily N-acetyltransferase